MNLYNNQRSDLFNSDLLDSSHYDDYDREDYGRYTNSQGKNTLKPFDSKERLKKDLMPNNYEQQSKLLFIFNILILREKR